MHKQNRAAQVRDALSLTPTQAGELFTGQRGKYAYDTWSRWERTGAWPGSVGVLLDIILVLNIAEYIGTPGADRALKIVLDMLRG